MVDFREIIDNIAVKTNGIKNAFEVLDYQSKAKLFNAQTCTFYGCELIDLASNQFDTMNTQWRKSIRYLLNLHPRTHCNLLPYIVGTPTAEQQMHARILCFFRRGLMHKSNYVRFFFRNCLVEKHSWMSRNVHSLCHKLSIAPAELSSKSERWLKSQCKHMEPADWRAGLVCELLSCRDGTMECPLTPQELSDTLNFLCID